MSEQRGYCEACDVSFAPWSDEARKHTVCAMRGVVSWWDVVPEEPEPSRSRLYPHYRRQRMRVNVYAEELTAEVHVVRTVADTGRKQVGIRFMQRSAPELHHDEGDDDRSAVTFWLPRVENRSNFRDALREALRLVDTEP